MSSSRKTTFFTFIWKIENFSLYVRGQRICFYSPLCKLGSTECKLELISRDRTIEIDVHDVKKSRSLFYVECELSFHPFENEDNFNQRGYLVGLKKDLHLPKDTLTIYCRVPQYPNTPSSQYLARTIFLRKILLWKIENFNHSQELHTTTFQVDSLHFDIELHKSEKIYSERFKTNYEWTFKQTGGYRVRSVEYEVTITGDDKKLSYGTARTKIFESESVGIPSTVDVCVKDEFENISLPIRCEFMFEVNEISAEDHQVALARPSCSRSAMIHDMLEGNIPLQYYNRRQQYLEKILEYFPTDNVGELQLEWAAKLHRLADKFKLGCLKEKCLSISNACKALVLADSSEDDELMRSVLDYICDHDDLIFSDEWKGLEEDNSRLITKVFRELYLRKVKNVGAGVKAEDKISSKFGSLELK